MKISNLPEDAVEVAKAVLGMIVRGDFDRRIPNAALGLKWLRDNDYLSERQGNERYPVMLSSSGRKLAIFWGLADV